MVSELSTSGPGNPNEGLVRYLRRPGAGGGARAGEVHSMTMTHDLMTLTKLKDDSKWQYHSYIINMNFVKDASVGVQVPIPTSAVPTGGIPTGTIPTVSLFPRIPTSAITIPQRYGRRQTDDLP